jgi:hypothetical protein
MRWKGCSHTTHTPFPSKKRTVTYLGEGDGGRQSVLLTISLFQSGFRVQHLAVPRMVNTQGYALATCRLFMRYDRDNVKVLPNPLFVTECKIGGKIGTARLHSVNDVMRVAAAVRMAPASAASPSVRSSMSLPSASWEVVRPPPRRL